MRSEATQSVRIKAGEELRVAVDRWAKAMLEIVLRRPACDRRKMLSVARADAGDQDCQQGLIAFAQWPRRSTDASRRCQL